MRSSHFPTGFIWIFTGLALGFGGCAAERPVPPPAPVADAAPEPAVPEMAAHAVFFGNIDVDVVLNRTGFVPRGERGAAGGDGDGRGGYGGGGMGRGRRGGGGRRFEGGAEARADEPTPHIVASNLPPVRLYLRFTNHTATPWEIEVPDFDSDLGNFVVQPAKITVPANSAVQADPMTSRLGVPAAEVPLMVTLRRNGQTEKQVLILRTMSAPAATAVAPASTARGN